MIEATCAACGTVNRIAEADLPPASKFVSCESCKARVMLPAKFAIPTIPKPVPAVPKKVEAGIADLPAPKRSGPLAGFESSKPAPRSGLDVADLPAPKAKSPAVPSPAATTSPLDLDDLMLSDLPAPKAKNPLADLPTPKVGVADLPAPRAKNPLDDLPAPKAKTPTPVPRPAPADVTDLLAPKPKASAPPRTPTPVPRPAGKAATPPTPTRVVAKPLELDDIVDLPAPRDGISDLPAPKPGANIDLPAPKGFFDDLPQPARSQANKGGGPGGADLPAPKGFFDDLPQPARAATPDLPAPKGFFDDLPQPAKPAAPALPAPKGFFDDLPQPAKPAAPAPPAPKGFFDDLTQPALTDAGPPPPLPAGATPAAPTTPNVFDDLPEPSAQELSSADLFAPGAHELDLGPANARHAALELDPGLDDVPELDLGLPTMPAVAKTSTKNDFGDLDLSAPSTPPPPAAATKSGINIKSTSSSAKSSSKSSSSVAASGASKSEMRLDLEDEPERASAAPATNASRREATKKKEVAADATAGDKARSRKRSRIALGALLGVVVAGAGGGFFYKRHHDAELRTAQVQEHLQVARSAIHQGAADHWTRAADEASAVLALDGHNVEALGLRAEALLGGVIDTGVGGEVRIAQGRKVLADALEAGITGSQLDAAQSLGMIASHQPDRATTKLQGMVQRSPKNGFWQLYLGWALSAKGDPAGAVKAFDDALAADPAVKLPALYARGRAKLQLVDLEGAKADFAAVLALKQDHIGAQVGLAAAMPAAKSSQREADLLAILARKDIASGDPRAVVQAWTLAGDVARSSGRLDVARDRYEKALALAKTDANALVGLAGVAIAENKLDVASDFVVKALAQAPESAPALLVASDLDVHQGKLDEALAIEQKLAARQPPLPPRQRANLDLLFGHILEAQGKDDDAITAWTDGAALAGDLDLSPMMAAVTKLSALAKKATDNHDDAKAAGYRAKADALLSSLADRAKDDAQLARTLGTAYLGAGDAVKAESFLRRAVEMDGTDLDAHLELAKALVKLERTDDALAQLTAAQALDASRSDIELELARTLEGAGRDADAAAAYAKVLQAKDVTVEARVHAGRFLARKGNIKDAAAQADKILAAEPDNPAGHYLKGEGLILAGMLDDARKELTTAVDGDPDPQYLDAQGRAAEATVAAGGDTKYYDLALRAYERAIAVAPTMFNPQAGTGRIYVARREWSKAIAPLLAATKIDPNNADVMFAIGITYKNLGQPQVAVKWLLAAVQLKKAARTYWELGQLYRDANNAPETVRSFTEATRLGDDEEKAGAKLDWLTEAYYSLGQTQGLAHNDAAARAAYQRFVDRNPPPGAQLSEARRLLAGELR